MNTKFKQGEVALHGNEKVIIRVAKKNFSTGEISYRLQDEEEKPTIVVPEKDLKKIPNTPNIKELRSQYKQAFGKDVPKNKKNDVKWMLSKLAENDSLQDTSEEKENQENAYDLLNKLQFEQLSELCSAKEELKEIDPEEYVTKEELLLAICEELEIEIPENKN